MENLAYISDGCQLGSVTIRHVDNENRYCIASLASSGSLEATNWCLELVKRGGKGGRIGNLKILVPCVLAPRIADCANTPQFAVTGLWLEVSGVVTIIVVLTDVVAENRSSCNMGARTAWNTIERRWARRTGNMTLR